MGGKDQTAGNEFDAWMNTGGPSVRAEGAEDEPAEVAEAAGKRGKGERKQVGKRQEVLARLARKPAVVIPVVLAIAVVGLMVVRGGGNEPTPTESQYAALTPAVAEPTSSELPEVDLTAYGQMGEPAGEAAAPLADADADTDASASVAHTDEAAPPAPEVASEPEPEHQPVAEAGPEPAADTDQSTQNLKLRVEALENDLERARQTREANLRVIRNLRAEVAKQEGQRSYSVVAVLNDGVVVRDGSGSERVYGLGARIGE